MRKLLTFFILCLSGWSCKDGQPEPVTAPLNRSVLVFSNNFPGTFEVTDYDANGLPTRAKTAITYNMDVIPAGTYTSSIKLEYDAQLRIRKTVQTYDQRGTASCCPDYIVHDPDQQIVNEYEYMGSTTNITHEINYSVNAKKAEKKVIAEYVRTFTDHGQLTQERKGTKLLYQASYDANDNVISETQFPDNNGPSFTRQWTYEYDQNKRLLSRRVVGTNIVERNTYDDKGRLVRQVSNLLVSAPFKPQFDTMGRLIDYRFAKGSERYIMSFSYFNGKFWADSPHVLTYEYAGEETLITSTNYVFWNTPPETEQPGFDFTQVSLDKLVLVLQTKWRLNKWNKLAEEESTTPFISDRVGPESRGSTYASGNTYSYDSWGNLVAHKGYSISWFNKERADFSLLVARYKNL